MIPRSLFQAPRAISRSYMRTLRIFAPRTNILTTSAQRVPKPLSFTRRFSQFEPLQSNRRPPPRIVYTRWDPREIGNAKPLIHGDSLRDILRSRGLKVVGVLIVGSGVVFYVSNLEEVPVSGRRRFNCFDEETVREEGKESYRMIMREYAGKILPTWDPRTQMVVRIMKRLIPASGLTDVDWEIHVINSGECNAFVIPGGKVFVFSGLFDITKNEDGMAAVLGHEIGHNQAKHMAETMSGQLLLIPLRFAFMFLDSMGITAGLGQFLGPYLLEFGISMPASRTQESEADYIGLLMMSRACYDPRAAVGVWERMEAAQHGGGGPQWLSTHPSNSTRIGSITKWLPEAETARNNSGCSVTMSYMQDFQGTMKDPWAMFK